ncbi:hypothetical protein COEREDRAFT_87698 [Coemansia reversa NRRL 1564]|uniref:Uncharacterized protein n=1 Tax=Coemansia reversa (strain ATCC 12441 / NRRL 1564) TaxID=763665 RepID=A0A2G5B9P3_COERN|nr:hypothetical protein COEREDRAFT_87698 [Coemansia reversa NRRL 1564]|eukprot:PIA15739.1 hypothetical protein COEREDRAFT_87698 [Coemansia reversa NRRL 1564]
MTDTKEDNEYVYYTVHMLTVNSLSDNSQRVFMHRKEMFITLYNIIQEQYFQMIDKIIEYLDLVILNIKEFGAKVDPNELKIKISESLNKYSWDLGKNEVFVVYLQDIPKGKYDNDEYEQIKNQYYKKFEKAKDIIESIVASYKSTCTKVQASLQKEIQEKLKSISWDFL